MVQGGLRKRGRGAVDVISDGDEGNNNSNNNSTSSYKLTRRVVSHHNQANDGWVIYKGGVFDVTTFLETHPGGMEIILQHLGGDVSAIMDGDDNNNHHAHSVHAFKMLEKYRIGHLVEHEYTNNTKDTSDNNTDNSEEMEGLVDWGKALLPQIGEMGDKYEAWIHSFPTTDHTVKMFQSDVIEGLTKCAWYVPLLFWVPVIAYEFNRYLGLAGGITITSIDTITFAASMIWGWLSWLLFEYTLHRYVFHLSPTTYMGNIIHFLIHGHHHITPMDFDRLVFPPVPAMILAAPFYFGAPKLLGIHVGYPWLFGFAIAYLVYDMTHFFIHHAVPRNKFLSNQKRRHVFHHYFDPSVNYGISNPLFDYVFQTIKEPRI